MSWDLLRETLSDSLPESDYDLWIKPLVCLHQDGQVIELAGPDRFFCSWVRDRYLTLFNDKLREIFGENAQTIKLGVGTAAPQIISEKSGQLRLPGVTGVKRQIRSLHPGYTFEQFMVGQSNVLAKSACQALAGNEKTFGNCLYINSSTGLGKSHLTQAVVHSVLQQAPSTMLHYMTAQQFSVEMINGIKNKSMDQFSQKYVRHCDMLLVEDVQTLVGRTKTQEQLNTILDYLIKAGKRVILTASVAPRKLDGIDDEFKSRMTSGLVTKIEAPDYATRVNIINHKARANGLTLDSDLVDYLARRLKGDIRKTESAVIGLRAKSNLLKTQPDKTMINEVLNDVIGTAPNLDGKAIQVFISSQFDVSAEELQSRTRKRSISFPRQVGMYLTRKYTDSSLADIGKLYNRDHSTVLHAIDAVTREMAGNASAREQIAILSKKLENR